jgi:hypothetical protein
MRKTNLFFKSDWCWHCFYNGPNSTYFQLLIPHDLLEFPSPPHKPHKTSKLTYKWMDASVLNTVPGDGVNKQKCPTWCLEVSLGSPVSNQPGRAGKENKKGSVCLKTQTTLFNFKQNILGLKTVVLFRHIHQRREQISSTCICSWANLDTTPCYHREMREEPRLSPWLSEADLFGCVF